ncbi:bacillithiol system redox-active protein YtxJ [Porifericola rhodea]|uniref:bacillithiol system redox-active protein YtxJ n=1 Tax=Porifericola rhodea TaxID=930972 RepID=UPI002665E4AE|nr:bacillithiol system redox-active protein YtxJ [Porifericola rhodea]WKN30595.1 bacillithiol system redox-active protein YtxJ [Porifericola rhodea]
MNWNKLDKVDTLQEIKEKSNLQPILIFKHSTRCSISSMALNRLERDWKTDEANIQAYFLDLIKNRDISNEVASTFNITHQSPQVLIIKDGKCVYDNSHMGISYREINEQAAKLA